MLFRKPRSTKAPQPAESGHSRRAFFGRFAVGVASLGAIGACAVDEDGATVQRSSVGETPVRCPW